jgi:hypothetical protein
VYAVIPPMALTILTRLVPHAFGPRWATVAAGVVAQMLTFLFAGATALLYVREIDPNAPHRLRHGLREGGFVNDRVYPPSRG